MRCSNCFWKSTIVVPKLLMFGNRRSICKIIVKFIYLCIFKNKFIWTKKYIFSFFIICMIFVRIGWILLFDKRRYSTIVGGRLNSCGAITVYLNDIYTLQTEIGKAQYVTFMFLELHKHWPRQSKRAACTWSQSCSHLYRSEVIGVVGMNKNFMA